MDQSLCPLCGIVGCLLLRDFEYIKAYGDTIQTYGNVLKSMEIQSRHAGMY